MATDKRKIPLSEAINSMPAAVPSQLPGVLLLDWDMTLCDQCPVMYESMRRTLSHFAPDKYRTPANVPEEVATGYYEDSTRSKLLEKELGADKVNAATDYYINTYKEIFPQYLKLLPGAEKTLETLKQRGVRLGIVSNKPQPKLEAEIDHFGLRHYFETVVGSISGVRRSKPDSHMIEIALEQMGIDPAQKPLKDIWYMGDSMGDVLAAEKAGIPIIMIHQDMHGDVIIERAKKAGEHPILLMRDHAHLQEVVDTHFPHKVGTPEDTVVMHPGFSGTLVHHAMGGRLPNREHDGVVGGQLSADCLEGYLDGMATGRNGEKIKKNTFLVEYLERHDLLDKVGCLLDFGCANGATTNEMSKAIKAKNPDTVVIGYDISKAMIKRAKKDNPEGIFYTNKWEEAVEKMEQARKKTGKPMVFTFSSVLHEIEHYSTKHERKTTWEKIWKANPDTIAIRDFFVGNNIKGKSDPEDVARVRQWAATKPEAKRFTEGPNKGKNILEVWEKKWGGIENKSSMLHFLLSYQYLTRPEIGERELNENYFSVPFDRFITSIPKIYEPVLLELYTSDNRYHSVKEDLGVDLHDTPTKYKLILQRNKGAAYDPKGKTWKVGEFLEEALITRRPSHAEKIVGQSDDHDKVLPFGKGR